MDIDEFILLKIQSLKSQLEAFKKDIKGRYPDEAPNPPPVTYKDWNILFQNS